MAYNNIWYISKYAIPPNYGNPTRQYFFAKYFSRNKRNVSLISSRSVASNNMPKFGLRNSLKYYLDGINGVLLNGPTINLGFNFKRILSWLTFEVRLLIWGIFKRSQRPDVIIVSSLSILTFLSGVVLKNIFHCKLVCEVRDIWPLTIVESKGWKKTNLFVRFLSFVEQMGYNNADVIIGTMPNLKGHVEQVSRRNSSKVKHIPMGIDLEYWHESGNGVDPFVDIFTEIPDHSFVVGYAGNIGLANCIDLILEAAFLLKNKNIVFILLGDGVLKDEYKNEAKRKTLDNVIFLDAVPKSQVSKFLEKCDLLLNPWQGGGTIYNFGVSPNKWIDYMNSAKPILVALDGYPSIINEAGCGKFIKANDPNELAKNILEFSYIDKSELRLMGEKGRKYLHSCLNYNILAKNYLSIIDSL